MRLKQLSDERASKWPNTLMAQRAKKLRDREEKAEKDEARRRELGGSSPFSPGERHIKPCCLLTRYFRELFTD